MVFTTDLAQSLQSIGLQEYTQLLQDEGFETWQEVLDITENDMTTLGIKLGHRRRLQRAILEARLYLQSSAPAQSSVPLTAEAQNEHPSNLQRSNTVTTTDGFSPAARQSLPQKRKYRRHPKPDEHAPERPPSAYVIFSNRVRERLKGQDLSFTEIAKIVGEQWQDPDPEERAACERQAQSLKETYYTQPIEYKKTPNFHAYQAYLVEFKAKHGDKNSKEAKRTKQECDNDMSTRSNSRERTLGGVSPRTDGPSTSIYAPSNHSSSMDGFSVSDSGTAVGRTAARSNHSQSPLFARPASIYNLMSAPRPNHDVSQDHADGRFWGPNTMPYREHGSAWPATSGGEMDDRGATALPHTPPYPAASFDRRYLIQNPTWSESLSDHTRARRTSDLISRHLPSPTSPLDATSRFLPPPPGLARNAIHPDPLQISSSRPQQRSAPIPAAPLVVPERSTSISLPPIRTYNNGFPDGEIDGHS